MKELKSYGDLTKLNKCRTLLDTIGKETLERIAHSYLDLLDTSAAIYEIDGSYATALFSSSYCKFMDRSSRALCSNENNEAALSSGQWICHESCWKDASLISIETEKPKDLNPCGGGINIFAVPIKAENKIIGSINIGYGMPPIEQKTIKELVAKYKVDREDLLKAARKYKPRPEYIVEAAKKHIILAAELIGELYSRKKAETGLHRLNEELEKTVKERTAEILESEERSRGIFDNAAAGVALTSLDGKFLKVNEYLCNVLGYTEDELLKKTFMEITYPDDLANEMKYYEKSISGELQKVTFEKRYVHKNGSIVWILISVSTLSDVNGKPEYFIAMIQDITERKKLLDELHLSEKEKAKLESEAKSAKAILNKTKLIQLLQEMTIISNEASNVSEAYQICLDKVCEFMNWPIGHVYLTDSDGTLKPSKIWHLENVKQFEKFRKVTEVTPFDSGIGLPGRVLASSKPAWITDVTKDSNFPRAKLATDINVKAGFALPVLEGKNVTAVLEFFSKEAIEPDKPLLETLSNLGIMLGRVSETKRAGEQINKLSSVVEQNPVSIIITDTNGNIEYVNLKFCESTGYSLEDIIGKNTRILKSGLQSKEFYENLWDTINSGKVWRGEFHNKKKNGEDYWESVSISPIKNEKGEIISFIAGKEDVTKLKEKQETIDKMNKEQEMFLRHELGNILNIISCNTELILKYENKINDLIKKKEPAYDSIVEMSKENKFTELLNEFQDYENKINSFRRDQEQTYIGIQKTSKRAINLTNSLKQIQDLENGTYRINKVDYDLNSLAKMSADNIRLLEHKHNVEMYYNNKANNSRMKLDPPLMQGVFDNLIKNAVEHMSELAKKEERCVKVDMYNEDDKLCVKINNKGKPISKDMLKTFFEKFNTKDKTGGTGLGTTYAYLVTKAHGGGIYVDSNQENGTTVTLKFKV